MAGGRCLSNDACVPPSTLCNLDGACATSLVFASGSADCTGLIGATAPDGGSDDAGDDGG
jgi:hypothetical protein